MQIKQFEYVLKVAEEGSITHAAEKLYVSQQNISESLKLLETELGFRIFQRSKKGVALTPVGQQFLNDLYVIMPIIQKWKDHAALEKNKLSISIYLQHALRSLLSDSSLIETLSQEEDVSIKWQSLSGFQILESLQKERLAISLLLIEDDSIIYRQLLALQSAGTYEITKISNVQMGITLRADDPLAQKEELELSDLEAYNFVCHSHTIDLGFLREIIEAKREKIYQLPEIIDLPLFILQHSKTFSYLPEISIKNSSFFIDNKLVIRPLRQAKTRELSCFLIYNTFAPKPVGKMYSRILNYFAD